MKTRLTTLKAPILDDVVRFIAKYEMAETTFGLRAVNDSRAVAKIRIGSMQLGTAEKVLAFISSYRKGNGKK